MSTTTRSSVFCFLVLGHIATAQPVLTFGGNSQHTAVYQTAAQDLNRIRWSTSIDLDNTGAFAHYGAPLITASNTVIVPVKIAQNGGFGFQTNVFNGAGTQQYSLATDYILPIIPGFPFISLLLPQALLVRGCTTPGREGRSIPSITPTQQATRLQCNTCFTPLSAIINRMRRHLTPLSSSIRRSLPTRPETFFSAFVCRGQHLRP